MAALSVFITKLKPALETFILAPSAKNLAALQNSLKEFDCMDIRLFHDQVLLPLVLNLEKLSGKNQDLRTGTIDCITSVISKLYIKDKTALLTILVIVLKEVRNFETASTIPNASEELKLAVIRCFTQLLKRCTSDVLEAFYVKESSMLLGQTLLALVDFINNEKYRTIVIDSIECLMTFFYVHDQADQTDVVLRNQVADTLFIYLPKIVTVLIKCSLADDKLGVALKATAIKALGRILCIVFDETNEALVTTKYSVKDFQNLVHTCLQHEQLSKNSENEDIFSRISSKKQADVENRLKRVHSEGRSEQWFDLSSRKLCAIFGETHVLRAHSSLRIRKEYAKMCCLLLTRCARHLSHNVLHMLESVVALTQDNEDSIIRQQCEQCLQQLQLQAHNYIFDEHCDAIFDEHLTRLPRLIKRAYDAEQYAAFSFLKGFLCNLSHKRLQLLLSLPKRLHMFGDCLMAAMELQVNRDLLQQEHSLRNLHMDIETNYAASCKLGWRRYPNLNSQRCIQVLEELCGILGSINILNQIIFEHFLELLQQQHVAMNEILLILQFMAKTDTKLAHILLNETLQEQHWYLQLYPDEQYRLKVHKPTQWYVDRTQGLYESAIEVRIQDDDSDDEQDMQTETEKRVSLADAQFNVLHTCIVLDVLAHSAQQLGSSFDRYIFRCLHRVLLFVGNSNVMVHQAALFALVQMQCAAGLSHIDRFIELHLDYIGFHLSNLLKRAQQSNAAVDILTVVLQFSGSKSLPYLDNVFQTLLASCSEIQHTQNINGYLRAVAAFLMHITRWEADMQNNINQKILEISIEETNEVMDLITTWQNALANDAAESIPCSETAQTEDTKNNDNNNNHEEADAEADEQEASLPRHISLVQQLLQQTLTFVSSSEQVQQILALECLCIGLPLLRDFENVLLPLVHSTWQPLVEKFRQRDPIVLQRCFVLLNVLATYAKDFLLKRSLKDVIPNLKQFLKESAEHSAVQQTLAKTQEYKLQLKLLTDFANLVISMDIENRILYDISEVICQYLAKEQPVEFQNCAIQYFLAMRQHNCPLVYALIVQRSHLSNYKENVEKLMQQFGLTL